MSAPTRSRCAGLLAALTSVVALSCGSDTIDLLPTLSGAPGGGASGSSSVSGSVTTAGTEAGGGGNGGMSGNGGTAGASAGVGGSTGGKMGNGGRNGCSGPGCGAGGELSLGGAFPFVCEPSGTSSCQPCVDEGQCPANQHCAQHVCAECARDDDCNGGVCDKLVHRCAPMCQNSIECRGGRVCDPAYNACVTCTPNGEGCPPSADMEARMCAPYLRRCVECLGDANCGGDRKHCVRYQCVCLNNADCGDGMYCDQNSGRCRAQ